MWVLDCLYRFDKRMFRVGEYLRVFVFYFSIRNGEIDFVGHANGYSLGFDRARDREH